MNYVTLLLRAGLALMFATAATGKFMDLPASRATVEAFGMPRRVARIGGTAIPIAETLCAIALLIQPTARVGAVAGALVILIFSGGIAYALRAGRAPECNCFGQISSAQISPAMLGRNAVIFAIAVLVAIIGPGKSLSGWTSNTTAAATVASLAALCAAGLLIVLLSVRGRVGAGKTAVTAAGAGAIAGASADGAPGSAEPLDFPTVEQAKAADPDTLVGKPAPDFLLLDQEAQPVELQALLAANRPIVIVFSGIDCAACNELLPELVRWSQALAEQLTIVVIESVHPDPYALAQLLPERGDLVLLCEPNRYVAEAYGVWGTPTGVAIGTNGLIQAGPAPGAGSVEALIRMTLNHAATTAGGV